VVSDSDGPVGPAVMVMAQLRGMPGPARIAPTEENGRFTFRSLPPGEYFLTAMDTGSRFFQLPPEIVENVGKAVTVGEGASVSADLRLTTAESLRLDAR